MSVLVSLAQLVKTMHKSLNPDDKKKTYNIMSDLNDTTTFFLN